MANVVNLPICPECEDMVVLIFTSLFAMDEGQMYCPHCRQFYYFDLRDLSQWRRQ
jgi:uncharacterized protein YbaR (Trm112 family)